MISWNYNGQAKALGSGCDQTNTLIIMAGNEVSIILAGFGVQMDSTSDGRLDRKTCRIIIPTRVKKGYYIGTIQQKLTYDYLRTQGTAGRIMAISKLYFDDQSARLDMPIPTPGYDEFDEIDIEASETTNFSGICSGEDYEGNFKISVVITGRRENTNEQLIIFGKNILVEALATPLPCP